MTSCRVDFVSFRKLNTSSDIYIANDTVLKATDIESVDLKVALSNETAHMMKLDNVLYASDLSCELLSNAQLTSNEARLVFDNENCFVYDKTSDNSVLHATKCRNQYSLNLIRSKTFYTVNLIVFYSNLKINEKALDL